MKLYLNSKTSYLTCIYDINNNNKFYKYKIMFLLIIIFRKQWFNGTFSKNRITVLFIANVATALKQTKKKSYHTLAGAVFNGINIPLSDKGVPPCPLHAIIFLNNKARYGALGFKCVSQRLAFIVAIFQTDLLIETHRVTQQSSSPRLSACLRSK